MKKKILTLMLAACMVTALTACGSSKEEGQSQDTTEVSETESFLQRTMIRMIM